ncbi:hypothetical protein [Streptomyces indicus]|uniref:Integral membrane protein n=1 Tax=Streptomyces indicus TaxID=417292 RepID=A0A1G9GCC3_9ACTN|nr:hypothetical protein [Streptomyces indicus]SDK97923.1 hypothetical protein SAMN05421806_115103 [Streptomyces indicus]
MPEDIGGPGPDAPGPDAQGSTDAQEIARLRARVAELEATAAQTAAQNSAQPTAPSAAAPSGRPRRRGRSTLATVLIVLGCLLAPLGVVAAWASGVVGDTDRYVSTVQPLASDPDVQDAVAARVTDAAMDHIDLNALLSQAASDERPLLEKALGRLGNSLEDAVRSFVNDKARDVVGSHAFETLWTELNRKAHAAMNKALTGDGGGAVQLDGDTVTVDLAPVVEQVKQRLVDNGLTLAEKIPEVHTEFAVAKSEDITKARTGFRLLQLVGNWLPVLALLLVAGGVLLARDRRRAVVTASICVALAVGLLGIALTVFRPIYLDALPEGVSQPAAGSVYDALTHFLRTTVRMVIALGVVVALAAWLTGSGRRAGLVRNLWSSGIGAVRSTADRAGLNLGPVGPWVAAHRRWIVWVLIAAAVLAYVLWSYPTGWVVLGLALTLLFALAVVDFLAGPPQARPVPAETSQRRTP